MTRKIEGGYTNVGFESNNNDEDGAAAAAEPKDDGLFFIGSSPVLQRKIMGNDSDEGDKDDHQTVLDPSVTVISPVLQLLICNFMCHSEVLVLNDSLHQSTSEYINIFK